jgi:hypothetical protein
VTRVWKNQKGRGCVICYLPDKKIFLSQNACGCSNFPTFQLVGRMCQPTRVSLPACLPRFEFSPLRRASACTNYCCIHVLIKLNKRCHSRVEYGGQQNNRVARRYWKKNLVHQRLILIHSFFVSSERTADPMTQFLYKSDAQVVLRQRQ